MTKNTWKKQGMGFKEIEEKSGVIKGMKVVLHWDCYEGNEGEYDETDPSDEPLLRFDVCMEGGEDAHTDNGSYCTQLTAYDNRKLLVRATKAILAEAENTWNVRFKKAMEYMSWIGIKDGKIV